MSQKPCCEIGQGFSNGFIRRLTAAYGWKAGMEADNEACKDAWRLAGKLAASGEAWNLAGRKFSLNVLDF